MAIKSSDKYLVIGIGNRVVKYFTGRSLYGKAALAAIGMVGVLGSTSLLELILTELIKPGLFASPVSKDSGPFNAELFKFVLSLLLLSLAFYWVRMANKDRKMINEAGKLVFEKNTLQIAEIGASRIHAFCGSITHISGIDIVVTSENTDLNLGSLNGTSVSGRIRNLAAERSATGEIVKDNLESFIQDWKSAHGKLGNFSLGHYIVCNKPYQAAAQGIKTIIFAVAIRKNSDGTSTIEEAAINTIVGAAVDTAVAKGQRTLFIPVFGLGSGNIQQGTAIEMTTNAVKAKLIGTNASIDIYIGVYRRDDLTELCMYISQL